MASEYVVHLLRAIGDSDSTLTPTVADHAQQRYMKALEWPTQQDATTNAFEHTRDGMAVNVAAQHLAHTLTHDPHYKPPDLDPMQCVKSVMKVLFPDDEDADPVIPFHMVHNTLEQFNIDYNKAYNNKYSYFTHIDQDRSIYSCDSVWIVTSTRGQGTKFHMDLMSSHHNIVRGTKVFVFVDAAVAYKNDIRAWDQEPVQSPLTMFERLCKCDSFRWTVARRGNTIIVPPNVLHCTRAITLTFNIGQYCVTPVDIPYLQLAWTYSLHAYKNDKTQHPATPNI
jgi:hypothetical protein